MEKIFNEKYVTTLKLVEKISSNLVKTIYKTIKSMPSALKRCILKEKSCDLMGVTSNIELNMEGSVMELKYVDLSKNYYNSINIYPFYKAELLDLPKEKEPEEHTMLIASFTESNSEEIGTTTFYYTEKDGNYQLDKCVIPNNAVEWDFSVYLDIEGDKYYLNYIISFNDIEYQSKKQEISLNELQKYSCDEFDEIDSLEDVYPNDLD